MILAPRFLLCLAVLSQFLALSVATLTLILLEHMAEIESQGQPHAGMLPLSQIPATLIQDQ